MRSHARQGQPADPAHLTPDLTEETVSLTVLLNLAAASGVVGVLLPALIALVNQAHWTAPVKGATTATLSLVAGLLTDWQVGAFRGAGWLVSAAIVLLAASGAYQAFWKPTRLAPLIEAATTFARSRLPKPPAVPPAASTP
jgi:HAMP domain-containing protein